MELEHSSVADLVEEGERLEAGEVLTETVCDVDVNPWFRIPPIRRGESREARRVRVDAIVGSIPSATGRDTDDFLDEKHRQIEEEYARYP